MRSLSIFTSHPEYMKCVFIGSVLGKWLAIRAAIYLCYSPRVNNTSAMYRLIVDGVFFDTTMRKDGSFTIFSRPSISTNDKFRVR